MTEEETDDNEFMRYLAQYLKDNENDFLQYSEREACDFINQDALELVLKRFAVSLT